jgi:hypothetical protein
MGPLDGARREVAGRARLAPLQGRPAVSNLLAMSKTRTEVMEDSRKKGIVAGVTTVGAVAAAVVVGPITAAVAAVPAAYYTWKWWKHRSENGIKF